MTRFGVANKDFRTNKFHYEIIYILLNQLKLTYVTKILLPVLWYVLIKRVKFNIKFVFKAPQWGWKRKTYII